MNSREKGARGEREWRDFLREHGVAAIRGQQRAGTEEQDVVHELEGFHFEVKRTEALRLWPAIDQARRDAENITLGSIPVVAHRSNRRPWIVILDAEDFMKLVRPLPPPPPEEE